MSRPDHDLTLVHEATDRLLHTVAGMDGADRERPSLCPDWSGADIVAHVTRNADSLVNLLRWGATGERTPAYPSHEARSAGIAESATVSPQQAVLDLRAAADRFAAAADALPPPAWDAVVRLGVDAQGPERPVSAVPWHRLREVEIHHVDLDLAYSPAHWPAEFVERMLAEVTERMGQRVETPFELRPTDGLPPRLVGDAGPAPVAVEGPAAAMLAWLLGRSTGDGLRSAGSSLPPVADWA